VGTRICMINMTCIVPEWTRHGRGPSTCHPSIHHPSSSSNGRFLGEPASGTGSSPKVCLKLGDSSAVPTLCSRRQVAHLHSRSTIASTGASRQSKAAGRGRDAGRQRGRLGWVTISAASSGWTPCGCAALAGTLPSLQTRDAEFECRDPGCATMTAYAIDAR
jgi:hypothetical protein